jgi:hypothetical protein
MGEIHVPARLVGQRYLCDQALDPDAKLLCGLEMGRVKGIRLPVDPPLYPHRCPEGHKKNLSMSYPTYAVIIEPHHSSPPAKPAWWQRWRKS